MSSFFRYPKHCKILVLGDLILDCFMEGKSRKDHLSGADNIVNVIERSFFLGGAANVANNLTKLGCDCYLVGVCGLDDSKGKLQTLLENKSIPHQLFSDGGRPTTVKTRVIVDDKPLIRLDEETCLAIDKRQEQMVRSFMSDIVDDYNAVIVSDYGKGFISDDLSRDIISMCKERNIPTFVDPQGLDWSKYFGATFVKPNVSELSYFSGKKFSSRNEIVIEATAICRKYNFKNMLITLGADGICLVNQQGLLDSLPSMANLVYDDVGAGDTVIAIFAGEVTAGNDKSTALKVASIGAGLIVGKVGTHAIDRSELDTAVKLHINLKKKKMRVF